MTGVVNNLAGDARACTAFGAAIAESSSLSDNVRFLFQNYRPVCVEAPGG